ncbi:hypothetical protein [Calidifontibacter indicus]|uniref:hypothetical protein n=1 Tax=Calidifontibacter indicus TaxID=419650 RepID=UPI003D738B51
MSATVRDELLAQFAKIEHLELGPHVNGETFPGTARSYLADGRGVAWQIPQRDDVAFAIDAEIADQPVSAMLGRRARSMDPAVVWPLWTGCEAAAKALDLPVLSWLNWPGLRLPADIADKVSLRWETLDDILVCYGVATL